MLSHLGKPTCRLQTTPVRCIYQKARLDLHACTCVGWGGRYLRSQLRLLLVHSHPPHPLSLPCKKNQLLLTETSRLLPSSPAMLTDRLILCKDRLLPAVVGMADPRFPGSSPLTVWLCMLMLTRKTSSAPVSCFVFGHLSSFTPCSQLGTYERASTASYEALGYEERPISVGVGASCMNTGNHVGIIRHCCNWNSLEWGTCCFVMLIEIWAQAEDVRHFAPGADADGPTCMTGRHVKRVYKYLPFLSVQCKF